jgi:hypothetical protein
MHDAECTSTRSLSREITCDGIMSSTVCVPLMFVKHFLQDPMLPKSINQSSVDLFEMYVLCCTFVQISHSAFILSPPRTHWQACGHAPTITSPKARPRCVYVFACACMCVHVCVLYQISLLSCLLSACS